MSTIQADIEARLSEVEPEVEVLLAEVVGGDLVRLFIDHPQGVTLDLCERVTNHLPEVRERYALEVSLPGDRAPALASPSTSAATSAGARVSARAATTTAGAPSPASSSTPPTTRSPWPRTPASSRSPTPTSIVRTSWETEAMSAEIVEAVKTLGREKGISEEKLMGALEDALLSRLQEAARRGALRPRAHGPRLRRLHRRGVPAARGPRGPAARRGRGAGHGRARAPRGPGDRRGHHPGGAGHRSRRA